jgi:molybdopterin molybdotransferase
MTTSQTMLTPAQAQQLVLDHVRPLGLERVPLLDALDRILGVDVHASYDNPPHDNSAMDGYAVRYEDIAAATPEQPAVLEMIEDIPAGKIGVKTVEKGQASRIMTGAPVPAGIDTVIRVEDTRADGNRIEILDPDELGASIRLRGEDMKEGELLIPAGTELGPGEVGVLASVQRTFVPVFRRPVITILSTGDELVEIEEPLEPGKIVNSNTAGLAAMALAHGAVPVMLPTAPDDKAAIRRTVESSLTGDFVVCSGGVSVGEYDFVKTVLDEMGAETILWRVAMKPGKPLFFCKVQGTPFFGLPGNPVSSLVSFLQFVRPAIRKASGHRSDNLLLPTARARMENAVSNDGDRRTYLRARLRFEDGCLHADTAYREQSSHILTSMLGANGIVIVEAEQEVKPGDEVPVQIIGRVF